jgi:hypothetical protein
VSSRVYVVSAGGVVDGGSNSKNMRALAHRPGVCAVPLPYEPSGAERGGRDASTVRQRERRDLYDRRATRRS